MFDHVEIKVRNFKECKSFYEQVLIPLGIKLQFATDSMAGFGSGKVLGADGQERTEFLIEASSEPMPHMHIAFQAPNRKAVDAFHARAMAAGARDNGAPGLRSDYHPSYYAAFVLDPDGHNVEAVIHGADT